MHGTELRELGAFDEGRTGWRPVHTHQPAILEHHEIAAPQAGDTHGRVAFRGEIAVRRETEEATLGARVEPTGEGRHAGVE